MTRYDMLLIVLPPVVIAVFFIILVYVIWIKRHLCVTDLISQSAPPYLGHDRISNSQVAAPTVALEISSFPVSPPSYSECVVHNNRPEVLPTYDEMFGITLPPGGSGPETTSPGLSIILRSDRAIKDHVTPNDMPTTHAQYVASGTENTAQAREQQGIANPNFIDDEFI